MTPKLQHFHVNSRVYVDASITLEVDDKHMEFIQTIGKLIFNSKKVDENFVINSCKEGGRISARWQMYQPIWQNWGRGVLRSWEKVGVLKWGSRGKRIWIKGTRTRTSWNTPRCTSSLPFPAVLNRNNYSIGSALSGGKWKDDNCRSRAFIIF